MKTFERSFPIRIHDVDAAGIVFFAQYYFLFHNVYEEFLEFIGHSIARAIDEGEYIIPIKTSAADYRRPMRHGETIKASLQLTDLRGSSFTIETQLIGTDNILRATITTRHVCVSVATMKPVALPESLRVALGEYLHSD